MVFSFFLIDKHFSKRYTNSTREVNAVLDSKDLEILQTMMTQIVAASESDADIWPIMRDSDAAMLSSIFADMRDSDAAMLSSIFVDMPDILPRFDKLADGHKLLLETLAPKSRVEELEEEIAFLKPLVMSMLTDIDKLKKAQ